MWRGQESNLLVPASILPVVPGTSGREHAPATIADGSAERAHRRRFGWVAGAFEAGCNYGIARQTSIAIS
jgi:hypothetical protein